MTSVDCLAPFRTFLDRPRSAATHPFSLDSDLGYDQDLYVLVQAVPFALTAAALTPELRPRNSSWIAPQALVQSICEF